MTTHCDLCRDEITSDDKPTAIHRVIDHFGDADFHAECAKEHDVRNASDEDLVYTIMEGPAADPDEPRGGELIDLLASEASRAHAMAITLVEFPRDDNDHDGVHARSGRAIRLGDCSEAEIIAARELIERGVETLAEQDEPADDGPFANVTAMPAPDGLSEMLGGLMGGGPGGDVTTDDGDRRGFQ